MSTLKFAVLASGGGSNFEALARAVQAGEIPGGELTLLAVNKQGVGALDRARRLGVPSLVLEPGKYPDRSAFYDALAEELESRGIGLVCLAGYLLKLEPNFVRRFSGRILNIHPSLLPKFGGKGMFGHHVHDAVIAAGEAESGCTVHIVDNEYDHGPVLLQSRVPVLPGDTSETLSARILAEEHRLYPAAVRKFLRPSP